MGRMTPYSNNDNDNLLTDNVETYPSRTYEWLLDRYRIRDYVEDLEAIKITVYHILNTERYNHMIYSWNYGVELGDLFGKPMTYAKSEVKRRIREALLRDDRIEDVDNFEIASDKDELYVTFRVVTNIGDFNMRKEVNINGYTNLQRTAKSNA